MAVFWRSDLRHAALVLLGGLFLVAPGETPADQKIIYECVDPETGEKSLRAFCQPGTEGREWMKIYSVGEPQLNLGQLARERPIEIYTVQECESCELLRSYLRRNRIPYEEKDVTAREPAQTSKETLDEILLRQAELKERSGSLTVPVLFIGGGEAEVSIGGFDLPRLKDALKQAGYPVDEQAAEGQGEDGEAGELPATEAGPATEAEPEAG